MVIFKVFANFLRTKRPIIDILFVLLFLSIAVPSIILIKNDINNTIYIIF